MADSTKYRGTDRDYSGDDLKAMGEEELHAQVLGALKRHVKMSRPTEDAWGHEIRGLELDVPVQVGGKTWICAGKYYATYEGKSDGYQVSVITGEDGASEGFIGHNIQLDTLGLLLMRRDATPPKREPLLPRIVTKMESSTEMGTSFSFTYEDEETEGEGPKVFEIRKQHYAADVFTSFMDDERLLDGEVHTISDKTGEPMEVSLSWADVDMDTFAYVGTERVELEIDNEMKQVMTGIATAMIEGNTHLLSPYQILRGMGYKSKDPRAAAKLTEYIKKRAGWIRASITMPDGTPLEGPLFDAYVRPKKVPHSNRTMDYLYFPELPINFRVAQEQKRIRSLPMKYVEGSTSRERSIRAAISQRVNNTKGKGSSISDHIRITRSKEHPERETLFEECGIDVRDKEQRRYGIGIATDLLDEMKKDGFILGWGFGNDNGSTARNARRDYIWFNTPERAEAELDAKDRKARDIERKERRVKRVESKGHDLEGKGK